MAQNNKWGWVMVSEAAIFHIETGETTDTISISHWG